MEKIRLPVIRLSSGAYVYQASKIGEKAHEEHLSGYLAPGVSGISMISQSRVHQHSRGSEHTVFLHFFEIYIKFLSDLRVFPTPPVQRR